MFDKVKKLYDKGKKAGGFLKKVYTIYKVVFDFFEYDSERNVLSVKFYVLSGLFNNASDTEKIEDIKEEKKEKEKEEDKKDVENN